MTVSTNPAARAFTSMATDEAVARYPEQESTTSRVTELAANRFNPCTDGASLVDCGWGYFCEQSDAPVAAATPASEILHPDRPTNVKKMADLFQAWKDYVDDERAVSPVIAKWLEGMDP